MAERTVKKTVQRAFLFSGSENWNNISELNGLLEKGYRVVEMSRPEVVNNKTTILVVMEIELSK